MAHVLILAYNPSIVGSGISMGVDGLDEVNCDVCDAYSKWLCFALKTHMVQASMLAHITWTVGNGMGMLVVVVEKR